MPPLQLESARPSPIRSLGRARPPATALSRRAVSLAAALNFATVLVLPVLIVVVAMASGGSASSRADLRLTGATAWAAGAMNVNDPMHRRVRVGFGVAGKGGRYTITASRGTRFDVSRGRGIIGPVRAGAAASAVLNTVHAADEKVSLQFSVAFPRGATLERVAVQARGVRGDAYRAVVYVGSGGHAWLAIVRAHGDRVVRLGRMHYIGDRIFAGARMHLELITGGVTPVQLQARAWVDGRAVPGWIARYDDTAAARVAGPGNVGIMVSTPANSRATEVRVSSFSGWVLRPVTRPTPPPTPGKPTPTPPTSAAPSPTPSTSTAPSTPPVPTTAPAPSTSAAPSTPPAPASSTTSAPEPTPSPTSSAPPPPAVQPRGSLPVGSADYAVPGNALIVAPDGNDANPGTLAAPMRTVKAAVARAGAGQTIVLRAGSYHEGMMIAPGKSVTIQAYPHEAVWFDGSVPVTTWARQGSTWVANGWTATFDHSASYTTGSDAGGWVNPSYPMAAYPDQVFVDGAQLAQVAAGQTPGPGQFAVDYSQHTLTIGSDPTGHEVRASDLADAFVVGGQLTLRGLGVRRYATPMPQIGTVFFGGSTGGDVVENVVVTDNATQGIGLGVANCVLNHVTSINNGLMGVAANRADNSLVENSVLSYNNTQHFNSAPSAGGIKISRSDHFVVRDNDVIGNIGVNGIWTDISTTHFTIADNDVVVDHGPYGILTELSDTGVVAGNSVSGAKYGYTAFDTGNVKVFNNVFSNDSVWDVGLSQDARRNSDPSTSPAAPWLVRNVVVADNVLGSTAAFQFYALDKETRIPVSSMNVVVDGNFFPTNSSRPVMVGWGGNDNVTVTYYRSPSAVDAGLGVSWHNVAAADDVSTVNGSAQSYAVPLPADVAAVLGVPAGTQRVGAA